MADNETIADIIAEMRALSNPISDGIIAINGRIIADRLEAAHKRECGNVAKLREALEAFVRAYDEPIELDNIEATSKAYEQARAALSVPPRNCDVGTEEEQFARFRKFCKKDSMDNFEVTAYCAYECPCRDSYDCKLAWAQMPYKEGGAK